MNTIRILIKTSILSLTLIQIIYLFDVYQSGQVIYKTPSQKVPLEFKLQKEWPEVPDFGEIRDTDQKKEAFFDFMVPLIEQANIEILFYRSVLKNIKNKKGLNTEEYEWIRDKAVEYRIPFDSYLYKTIHLLLQRIDVVPTALVLAQAVNESSWGSSRFARLGNNYFGMHCHTKGCGMLPRRRDQGRKHEVTVYSSPLQSVRSYIKNLNRRSTYQLFRNIRLHHRSQNKVPPSTDLTHGLMFYSERGQEYIDELEDIIQVNELEDKFPMTDLIQNQTIEQSS